MIIKTQTANAVNAQCFKKEQGVDWRNWCPERGSVILVNLGENHNQSSVFQGIRPAVVISNNINNKYSTVIQIAPITSNQTKGNIPVHVKVGKENGLKLSSFICIEQTKCINKNDAMINGNIIKISQLDKNKLKEIDKAIMIQFGLV